ncbi:winged helix-turn-helix domain-containing protein [Pelolinea submarina]|uniref:Winged helix DNA-binding protein n=1 Tax=Pelolinea submarina TaxID=913107 RepID=A0A347ZWK5_9CHLR|nr:crosslink repair DNA glycosylase YcaQ family protein [Pelolinea submarina]REG05428.1 hypothetical protein DFR64_2829 [Pelolinea submarina]BBB49686.1 hypothetical protein Pelsub_P2917 [Pelolinea submarina]
MDNSPQILTSATYRRFVLGAQGLWPARRWAGKDGTAQAIRAAEAVQVDPVAVVAQSHDIALWGRVRGYSPQLLQELVYSERQFFDYGSTLLIYPIEEFPYWHRRMLRRQQRPAMVEYFEANAALLEQVRAEIRARGPLRSRDLQGEKVYRYRSTKDSGVAMYNLWLTGELTIHSRIGRDRVYDFTDKLIPKKWLSTAAKEETDAFFLHKALAQHGLSTRREFTRILKALNEHTPGDEEIQAKIDDLLNEDTLRAAQLEGSRETLYYLPDSQPLLDELSAGRVPAEWALLEDKQEEVIFLAPLEFVSARGRAKGIFQFEYTWEIYKPAHTRVYGPYTLPMLYGDRLVGRMDAKLDRPNRTLIVNGLWLEEGFHADAAYQAAFERGLAHFARFLGAERVDKNK